MSPAQTQAVLPHSSEAERAVLAAILLSPHLLAGIAQRLELEDFHLDHHRLVFQAMIEVGRSAVEIDLRTLQGRLEQCGSFERVGGLAFLSGLDLDLPDLGRIDNYVELVKERSIRRRLITSLSGIVRCCFDGHGVDAGEALRRVEQAVLGLGTQTSRRDLTGLDELYDETLEQLEQRVSGELLGLPSGFPDWDHLTEGLVAGNLIILAGRPRMGKTSLALDVARHVALRQTLPVAVFSLEMSRRELTQRLLSSESGLPFADLRAGRLGERHWSRLYATLSETRSAPLYVDDSARPSILEIAAKARRLQAEHGLSLLVVDYLQLLESQGGRSENRQQEVTALSRGFKILAKELDVPVLVLSQLSRKPDERPGNHRPVLSDLRESGAIEQDADMVCFVYREEVYNKDDPGVRGLAELIVEKNRNGPTGTVPLVFLGERATFRSRTR